MGVTLNSQTLHNNVTSELDCNILALKCDNSRVNDLHGKKRNRQSHLNERTNTLNSSIIWFWPK